MPTLVGHVPVGRVTHSCGAVSEYTSRDIQHHKVQVTAPKDPYRDPGKWADGWWVQCAGCGQRANLPR